MIRQISCYILIVLLPVIYSEAYPKGSPGIEVPQRSPECEVYCKERNKVCFSAPTKCGACLQGFVHYDGRCMELLEPERNDFQGDSFIDRVAEQRELEKAAQEIDQSTSDVSNNNIEKQSTDDEASKNNTDDDPPPQSQPHVDQKPPDTPTDNDTLLLIAVVAACSVAGVVGLVVAGVCWYRLQKNAKAASEVEYPAYGVTGPPQKEKVGSPGDRKLAQSAQMYHYQHQKQQMIAMEKANGDMNKEGSEADSDEENEEGDYTVYECPGLAPTGEMEVKNPLFNEDTPVTPNK